MIGYKRVNLFELCRLCTTYEGCKTPIFEGDGKINNVAQKIRGCLQVEVKLSDSLPKYICLECLKKLEECHNFKTACRSSDVTLRKYAETLSASGSQHDELMVYVKDNKLSNTTTPKSDVDSLPPKNIPAVAPTFTVELSEVVESEVVLNNAGDLYVEGSSDKCVTKNSILNDVDRIFCEKSDSCDETEEETMNFMEQEKEWEMKRHDEGYLTYCPLDDKKDGEENRVHECDICTKQFKRKEHLTQHKRLHSGERPYKCDYCAKSFNRKEHLVRHARSHTGEKCYSCDVCSRGFSRKDNLRKHQATHDQIAGECVSKRSRQLVQVMAVGAEGEGRTLIPSSAKRIKAEQDESQGSILILNDGGSGLIQLDGKQSILLKALTQES